MQQGINKVVLAYSGGLDTSAIVPWLKENYNCEVITFTADIGQGDDELRGLADKAHRSGAVACQVDDLRREWLTDYVWPCLRAMTVYEGRYLLGTAMARRSNRCCSAWWSRCPWGRGSTRSPPTRTEACAISTTPAGCRSSKASRSG